MGKFEIFGLDVGGVQTERRKLRMSTHFFFSDLHFRGTNTSLR